MDFDKGFGIGGLGRRNLRDEEAELIARGEMNTVERQRQGPMPHGQLWQPCWCGEEPVCLDCEGCEKHCGC